MAGPAPRHPDRPERSLFDTAGVKTTAGSGVFKDRIPTEDAEVVRRLKAAGAVLLGKTNMQEFAFGGTSIVSYFGAVHNPWELSHISGGSSGGSAAALAAELCYGASDPIPEARVRDSGFLLRHRGPSSPRTAFREHTRGVIPLSWSLDHVGPITRTVADAAVLLQAIAGYDPAEITSRQMPVPEFLTAINRNASMLRLGIARDFFFAGLNPRLRKR